MKDCTFLVSVNKLKCVIIQEGWYNFAKATSFVMQLKIVT